MNVGFFVDVCRTVGISFLCNKKEKEKEKEIQTNKQAMLTATEVFARYKITFRKLKGVFA